MDVQAIQTLISSLGFPIVCTLGLGIFVFKIWKAQREDNNKQLTQMSERCLAREERLYQQMDKYNQILSDAVETLTKIDTRISVLEEIVSKNEEKKGSFN